MPPALLACLLILLVAAPRPWSVAGEPGGAKPRAFPLRSRQVPVGALPRPPSKLRFHHNVSLTVSLAVGTPPQNVTMVLDTGSELSWLLCATGRAAAAAADSFRPRASATSRDLPAPPSCDAASRRCRVSLSYADGSASDGALATDVFAVGDAPPLRSAFGCMSAAYDSSPDAVATAGLLGMNRGALSFVTQASTRRFSYCISDRDDAGVLLLGHSDLPFLPLNYTPLYQPTPPLPYFDRVAYSVQLSASASAASPCRSRRRFSRRTTPAQGRRWWTPARSSPSSSGRLLRRQSRVLETNEAPSPRARGPQLRIPRSVRHLLPRAQGAPAAVGEAPARDPAVQWRADVGGGGQAAVQGPRRARGADGVWCLTFGNADMVPLTAYVIGHHHQMNLWVEYDLERGRVGLAPVKCDVASERLGLML
ncbi:Aspartic proteinase PCS1 [Zea mays]|uniref:Aspartic proteinase PCS1 n=1 Tax=Zea mays TaxID=4577 RepID=A0A3L6GBN0_MAIZE|nr:Aspartic proteinase PCS1 [Zea mays]